MSRESYRVRQLNDYYYIVKSDSQYLSNEYVSEESIQCKWKIEASAFSPKKFTSENEAYEYIVVVLNNFGTKH